MTRWLLLAALGLLASGPALAQDGAQECQAAAAGFDSARGAGDLDAAIAAYKALPAAACGEELLYCAGNALALAHLGAAYDLADQAAPLGQIIAMLETGRTFGAPWQLLVGLADLNLADARERGQGSGVALAATLYQDAINSINEPAVCANAPALPGPDEIASIHKRMSEAVLLAPQFETVRTRAGGCGGIFLASVRGFTPTYRPLPINFEFNQAQFTPAGRDAAEQLLACLLEDQPERISLSGHTDAKGADGYNLTLSERRLETVGAFLREGGYEGEVNLLPRGESEPFEPDDPNLYSEAEIDQMNRRVALVDSGN